MRSGSVTGDNATEAVVEAANAVAGEFFQPWNKVLKCFSTALITVAEEDLEASVLVKDVQARLQVSTFFFFLFNFFILSAPSGSPTSYQGAGNKQSKG